MNIRKKNPVYLIKVKINIILRYYIIINGVAKNYSMGEEGY